MLLADANMRNVDAELPHHLHLGIPQPGLAVLDAERPLAAEGLMIVRDAEGLALGDAFVVVVLVASGADGVVDTREADVLHRNDPVSVRRGLVSAAGAPKAAAGILGAECRRENKKEEIQGGYQLHLGASLQCVPKSDIAWKCGNLLQGISFLHRRRQYPKDRPLIAVLNR